MGLIETIAGPLADWISRTSTTYVVLFGLATFIAASIIFNVLSQVLFKNKNEPPIVFHWVPFIGSTISYGIDPYKFFFDCKQKYGDIFTFILLGKKTTVFLGTKGNDFILNGKLSDVNAEEIYQPLTAPVFGKDVVYDCPNAKLMEQKKFVKFGLTTEAFKAYVPLIVGETMDLLRNDKQFKGKKSGIMDVPPTMGELTIYTASRALQGREVRSKFDSGFATLFHDLDAGFQPINFMLPWAPLPQNRKRDRANRKMAETYLEIIKERRAKGTEKDSEDMIWNLMQSVYKNGVTIPDQEIAHMMIALLMAGQHSSATTASFILLRLAANPHIMDELHAEQQSILGQTSTSELEELTYENLSRLPLHAQCIKETLRIHAPIHSILRKVTSPMHVEGTGYTIPPTHTLLAAPGVTSRLPEFFPNPEVWDPHRWDAKPSTTNSSSTSGTNENLPADANTTTSSTTGAPTKESKEEVEEEKIDYGYGLVTKGTTSPYLPFGAGRHRCIGEQFAYLQLTTILATFVREIKLWGVDEKGERTRGEGARRVPGTDYSSLFSRPLRPAVVGWGRREGGVTLEGKKES